MFRPVVCCLVLCLAALPAWGESMPDPWALSVSGQSGTQAYLPIDPGAPMQTRRGGSVSTQAGRNSLSIEQGNDLGLLVPNLDGGYTLVPGGPRPSPAQGTVEAQELKLRVRELVAQLLDTWPNQSLAGVVAVPTTFVSLDNFNETSGLGRYMAEALFYEFNTRGFAVREYRTNGTIRLEPGQGEFTLSRALPDMKVDKDWAALVVGTYYRDRDAVFVNARMVRPSDGLVLRTAQLVLPMNDMVRRMTAQPPFRTGAMRIVPGRK